MEDDIIIQYATGQPENCPLEALNKLDGIFATLHDNIVTITIVNNAYKTSDGLFHLGRYVELNAHNILLTRMVKK